ncbi:MAG: hypothetical protein GX856_11475, partial [Gammaproteobacteria bacterium]|nr:hypothetical protein [Gammaproteobacteria bacterium]
MRLPAPLRRWALPLLLAFAPGGLALAADAPPDGARQAAATPPGAAIASAHTLATQAGMQ